MRIKFVELLEWDSSTQDLPIVTAPEIFIWGCNQRGLWDGSVPVGHRGEARGKSFRSLNSL